MSHDFIAATLTGGITLALLRSFEETAKRGVFEQKLNRKLVHISFGLVFMLFWPLFSFGPRGAIFAALVPGINIPRVLLVGSGMWKDEAIVKSMSRFGDRRQYDETSLYRNCFSIIDSVLLLLHGVFFRELLKGPLYYAMAMTLATVYYWRTSPIAIAVICNMCAGDGLADIIGRRFGHCKMPYNSNKSWAGSIAMASAGFLASLGYMFYFSSFGFIQESWEMALGFFLTSLASALVESLPISSELDDNLTVPLTSVVVGSLLL